MLFAMKHLSIELNLAVYSLRWYPPSSSTLSVWMASSVWSVLERSFVEDRFGWRIDQCGRHSGEGQCEEQKMLLKKHRLPTIFNPAIIWTESGLQKCETVKRFRHNIAACCSIGLAIWQQLNNHTLYRSASSLNPSSGDDATDDWFKSDFLKTVLWRARLSFESWIRSPDASLVICS